MKTDSKKPRSAPAAAPRRGLCPDARPVGPRVPSLSGVRRGGGSPVKTVFLALAVGLAVAATLAGAIVRPASAVSSNLTAR